MPRPTGEPATPDRWLRSLRAWADLLDSRFRIPGTGIRFGLDPILSLLPGVGDLASPIFTIALLVEAVRRRVPRIVMVRMVLNALIDAAIGVIPVAGNIGDIFWRANLMNLALLERHASTGRPTWGDYAFVWMVVIVVLLVALVPVVVAWFIARALWHWLM